MMCSLARAAMASSMKDEHEMSSNQCVAMSVQELAKHTKITIPQNYLLQNQDPLATTDPAFFPIPPTIDMKQLTSSEPSQLSELHKLHSACKTWGLFQLVNHGVCSSLLDEVRHEIEEFFEIPLEEKVKLFGIKAGEVEGYGTVVKSEDQKLDWGDKLYFHLNPVCRRKLYDLLPLLRPSLKKALDSYVGELRKLAKELLTSMAVCLKMEVEKMEEIFENGFESARMSYYPSCPCPEMVMGLAAHSDGGGLTFLHQLNQVEGLQVKRDGLWFPVNPLNGAFIVNLGDVLEIVSNGVYKSIEHRAAVNTEKGRMSIAVFFSPNVEAQIGPASGLINSKNPPLFRTVGMQEYFKSFFSRPLNGKSNLDHFKIAHLQPNP